MIEVVTIGWLTVDDIVLTNGTFRQGVVGGGALYSAVGAQIFADHVGIQSICGRPFFERVTAKIKARGLDAEGIRQVEGNGLELWLLHESDIHKQQIPKLSSSKPVDMDRHRGPLGERYILARGFHIAPQSPEGSMASLKVISTLDRRPVVTMDILSDVFVDAQVYQDLSFLDNLVAFLPSESEIMRIWGPQNLKQWLHHNAVHHHCHLVAKLGERGSLVCEASTGRMIEMPALPVDVLDTTGAGDAYCGGFLAGLVAQRSLIECAAMATVSASYVVEACGALATVQPLAAERNARLEQALSKASLIDA